MVALISAILGCALLMGVLICILVGSRGTDRETDGEETLAPTPAVEEVEETPAAPTQEPAVVLSPAPTETEPVETMEVVAEPEESEAPALPDENTLAHAAYESIIAEYQAYFSIPIQTAYDSAEDYSILYPDIDYSTWDFFYAHAYGGALVYSRAGYAYYDVDGNGVDELLFTSDDVSIDPDTTYISTVYAWNGAQVVQLIGGAVSKESLSINTDGLITVYSYYWPHEITSYRIDSSGSALTQIEYLSDVSEEDMDHYAAYAGESPVFAWTAIQGG